MIRDLRASEVYREIISPGFFMQPPDIRHVGRIPVDALTAMQFSWRRTWFPPRPVRISVVEDVFVSSEGLVICRNGDVIQPTVQQHTDEDVAAALAAIRDDTVPRVRGDVLLCRKPGAGNYGHWLAEMLPRAWLASQHWPHPLRVMVQSVGEPLRSVMRQSLARLGIAEGSCVEAGRHPVALDRAILVDGLTAHGVYMSPLVIECLQTMTASIPPTGGDRLLVTRGALASRRFSDETAIVAEAAASGFTVLDTATMTFPQQVAAFKAARRIVGAAGAALANLAFAEPGADVSIFTPAKMPDTFYWFIGGLRGLRSVDFRCEQDAEWIPPVEWNATLRLDPEDRASVFAPMPPERGSFRTPQELAQSFAALFEPTYYLAVNPDVAAVGIDPLEHYTQIGWREGRNPSPSFDTLLYLRAHPDVAQAQIDPLTHYVLHGQSEGRSRE